MSDAEANVDPVLSAVTSPGGKVNAWHKRSPNVSFSSDTPPAKFADIISEQLAEKLNISTESAGTFDDTTTSTPLDIQGCSSSPITIRNNSCDASTSPSKDLEDTSSDAYLAKILQHQFDKEYNRGLVEQERRVNGKVMTSLQKFKIQLGSSASSSDAELSFTEGSDHDKLRDLADSQEEALYFEDVDAALKSTLQGRNAAYDSERREFVSKHDVTTCYKKNAQKMEAFPVNFNTGDTSGVSMNNNIFNSLKQHAHKERRSLAKVHEAKEKSTAEHAVDTKTRTMLFKLVNAGVLEEVNGVISVGKEAVVLHAKGGTETPVNQMNSLTKAIPENIAIKVFKTTMGEFRHRDKYIADDYRFHDRFKKLNSKKLAYLWAEKECRNLERLENARIPSPEVVLLRKHLLLLRFIGSVSTDGGSSATAAPKLAEVAAKFKPETKLRAFTQVIEIMKKMYSEARLVHADLSEFNLLWHENKVWVIDMAQAVEPQHPRALEFLYRDCCNVTRFFGGKLQLEQVPNPRKLLLDITGIDLGMDVSDAFYGVDVPTSQEKAEFTGRLEEIQARAANHAQAKRDGDRITLDDDRIVEVRND